MRLDTFLFVLSVCLCVFSLYVCILLKLPACLGTLSHPIWGCFAWRTPTSPWLTPTSPVHLIFLTTKQHWTNTKLPLFNDSKNYTTFLIMTHNACYHWRYCWYWYTFFPNLMNCIQHFMVSIEFIWSDRILNNSFHLAPEMTPTKATTLCWICEQQIAILQSFTGGNIHSLRGSSY